MAEFATAFTRSQSVAQAVEEVAAPIEATFGGAAAVGGGFVFATAASGSQGVEIGAQLAERWPEAVLLGSSFEGLLAGGQVFRDVPAMGLMAWSAGSREPIPFSMVPGPSEVEALAGEVLAGCERAQLSRDDLLLIFPDSLAGGGLADQLGELLGHLGDPALAGAAASGLSGGGCRSWVGEEDRPSMTVGLLIPGNSSEGAGSRELGARVRCAGATRFASPWLEVSACRSRWVDGLDGEPPIDWIRRQLGLSKNVAIEPQLDRLLVRVREKSLAGPGERGPEVFEGTPCEASDGDPTDFVERFVVGLDSGRGAISIPESLRRGDHLALALPDPDFARSALRAATAALRPSDLILQFACRARDESLYGDADLEPALVAAEDTGARSILGTLAPFQLGQDSEGGGRILVFSTILAALGEPA